MMQAGTAGRTVGSGGRDGSGGHAAGGRPGRGGTTGTAGSANPSGGSVAILGGMGGEGDAQGIAGAGTSGTRTDDGNAGEGGDVTGIAGEGGSSSVDECSPGSSVAGPIVVASQGDLELLRGVATVAGDLSVQGEVTSLGPLHCLEHVGGTMTIDGFGSSAVGHFSAAPALPRLRGAAVRARTPA
jgi:hypothetical protein